MPTEIEIALILTKIYQALEKLDNARVFLNQKAYIGTAEEIIKATWSCQKARDLLNELLVEVQNRTAKND